eukprot:GHVU01235564.1.p1 GENE.GHVU01235564.1~~GHVU01235564.1.p1  ORF type:complete len:166 (-),score=9.32 GHVU01235564.1:751-1248(-)
MNLAIVLLMFLGACCHCPSAFVVTMPWRERRYCSKSKLQNAITGQFQAPSSEDEQRMIGQLRVVRAVIHKFENAARPQDVDAKVLQQHSSTLCSQDLYETTMRRLHLEYQGAGPGGHIQKLLAVKKYLDEYVRKWRSNFGARTIESLISAAVVRARIDSLRPACQ